ncbi:efflux MFS transporter permease [Sphingobacterium litopenaei]|uniref:MFS transporter n=1 Tax=Sphingobacterium litopenaei TaxID=2763500 RepID=A0ABR7YHP4_9SPHI|nr:hypothetical protein [Sphingobacterium litopenaei]MBD1430786.1 hypothetical protein [Sphingobacterium litopenaei]
MEKGNSLIKSWVPGKLAVPLLVFAMFPHLMLLSMFNLNSTFTASFLDMEVEDLQFMFSMAYAMIVCGLFVHSRLFGAMNVRLYLLVTTMLNIVILAAMTFTRNPELMIGLRIIQGPLSLFEGCIMIPVLINAIKTPNAKFIAYAVLYSFMLTGDKYSLSIVKFAIENYSHNAIIYTIIGFHLLALLIYLLLLNPKRVFPKKQLYQLSLGGVFLLAISLMSGAFFLVYGKKYNWFEFENIILSLVSFFVFAALFLFYQITNKRPLFHFDVFKSERVVLGVILFFCFYVLRSSMSNIYQVMSSVWKWPWEYILQVQYFNVVGSLVGITISYFLFTRNVPFKTIFILAFSILSACMLWFSYLFYPETGTFDIGIALFTEGVGQGILITPLVFSMIGSVHPSISGSASQAGTATRFWTSTFGFALMQNLIWHLTTKHEFLLTQNLDVTHPIFQQAWSEVFGKSSAKFLLYNDAMHISVLQLKAQLAQQALLVANMEIFRGLFIFGILIVLIIIIYRPIKSLLLSSKVK